MFFSLASLNVYFADLRKIQGALCLLQVLSFITTLTENIAERRAGGLAGCLMGRPGARKLVPSQVLLWILSENHGRFSFQQFPLSLHLMLVFVHKRFSSQYCPLSSFFVSILGALSSKLFCVEVSIGKVTWDSPYHQLFNMFLLDKWTY